MIYEHSGFMVAEVYGAYHASELPEVLIYRNRPDVVEAKQAAKPIMVSKGKPHIARKPSPSCPAVSVTDFIQVKFHYGDPVPQEGTPCEVGVAPVPGMQIGVALLLEQVGEKIRATGKGGLKTRKVPVFKARCIRCDSKYEITITSVKDLRSREACSRCCYYGKRGNKGRPPTYSPSKVDGN